MGISAPCPYCGATAGAPGERRSDPMWRAVDALYQEVARIRRLAETGTPADQSEEIRMLQETVARLRGRSVAAAQYGHNSQNGQHPARAAHRPAATSSLAPGSRTSSAA